jgi:hypothetical protein
MPGYVCSNSLCTPLKCYNDEDEKGTYWLHHGESAAFGSQLWISFDHDLTKITGIYTGETWKYEEEIYG